MGSTRERDLLARAAKVVGTTQKAIRANTFARYRPVEFQREWFESPAPIKVLVAGNQSGKTTFGAIRTISSCVGVEPLSLGGTIPPTWAKGTLAGRKFLAAGETYDKICTETILPKLREYLADDMIVRFTKTGKFVTGIEWASGATLALRTYEQGWKKFEGGNFDGAWFDEPPPQDIFQAVRRGQIATNGWALITATPLAGSAWMLDDLITPATNLDCTECSGGAIPHDEIVKMQPNHGMVAAFKAGMHDNCRQHHGGYLDHDEIYKFLDSIKDPQLRAAREFGSFQDYGSLTFSYVKDEVHVVPDFKAPANWPLVEMVDPAPTRGLNIIWFVCDEQNRWRAVKAELVPAGGFAEMARQVVFHRQTLGRHPDRAFMDPRGGHHKQITAEAVEDWFTMFRAQGLEYEPAVGATHDNAGVKVLHDWLTPEFDPSKGSDAIPRLRFCKRLRDMKEGPLWAFERFQWSPLDSPKKRYGQKFKDWVDCAMMLALTVEKQNLTFERLRARMGGGGRALPGLAESYASTTRPGARHRNQFLRRTSRPEWMGRLMPRH